ncbi:hypothetical protein H6G97_34185 [Nostoc flagelliforme FACHB-838]|uniref:Uncharacterized protein n=1 Tax=Nostoc flagelliforme FACHB-838 TaxID=2692904 RepID=A0ABR8E177_9NOSO|nr:hypothetical protein [Nostoc flagelliforme]MBD2534300.1 hypothetical protein [Nostoc flagelliforme FACHB-838]
MNCFKRGCLLETKAVDYKVWRLNSTNWSKEKIRAAFPIIQGVLPERRIFGGEFLAVEILQVGEMLN